MDSIIKPEGDMGPSLRPSIFCPLCGSEHRFDTAYGEQIFILGRVVALQNGYRCSIEDDSLVNLRVSDPVPQQNQGPPAEQLHQAPGVPFAYPREVLANVLAYLEFVAQNLQAGYRGVGNARNNYNIHPNEEHPAQARSHARGDSNVTEASTIRLPQDSTVSTPEKNSPSLTETSMDHQDYFSPRPTPEEGPIQGPLLPQNSPHPTEASPEILGAFNIAPDPDHHRSDSMPAGGHIWLDLLGLEYDNAQPPMHRRTESLPADRNDWDEYQERVDMEDFSSDAGICGSTVAERMIIDSNDNDADEAASVDSDRTVTPSVLRSRENNPVMVQTPDFMEPTQADIRARFSRLMELAIAAEVAQGGGL